MTSREGQTMRNCKVCTVHLIQSGYKSRTLRWAGHIARIGKGRNAIKTLKCKPTGMEPLGISRCRWGNIKINIKEIGINTKNWIY